MVAVFVRVKVAGDKGKVSEENERFFEFLGLEGSTVEEKSSVYGDEKERWKPVGFQLRVMRSTSSNADDRSLLGVKPFKSSQRNFLYA